MNENVVDHPNRKRIHARGLLRRVHESARDFVLPRLDQLLTALDDELFARAEVAVTDRAQQQYFDAMRLLRFERYRVRKRFESSLDAAPTSGPGVATPSPQAGTETGGRHARLEGLTLLADEDLEQRLAVSTMSSRVAQESELDLLFLEQRLEALRLREQESDLDADIEVVAWRPEQFAEAFADAIRGLDVTGEVRLVLFKLFEHGVLKALEDLYPALNELLVEADVLPDLTPSSARREAQRNRRGRNGRFGEQAQDSHAPDEALRDDRTREDHPDAGFAGGNQYGHSPSGHSPSGHSPSGHYGAEQGGSRHAGHSDGRGSRGYRDSQRQGYGGGAQRPRSVAEFLGSLRGLQGHRRFSHAEFSDAGSIGGELVRVSSTTQARLRTALTSGGLDVVPQRVDLAAALLADLAVAMGDHGGDGSRAALSTQDEDVVNLVQLLFDRILRDDNLPVPMRALLARMQFPLLRVALADPSFLADPEHETRQFLNRLTEAGIGWARADERAQDRLYRVIEAIVERIATAEHEDLASDAALLKTLHEELRAALQVEAEELQRAEMRAVAQEQARIEAERTRQLVARLVEHRAAMVVDPALQRFLTEHWQQVMLRAHLRDGGQSEQWKRSFMVLRRLSGGNGPEAPELEDAISTGLSTLVADPARARRAASRVVGLWNTAQETWNEPPQRQPRSEERPVARNIERLPERGALEFANALSKEDWVEFRSAGGESVRGRLASITESPERCIFLNRRGIRIETLSRLELAAGIETGRIRMLDTHQLFDSALEAVIGGLRVGAA